MPRLSQLARFVKEPNKCPACGKAWFYYRRKTDTFVCRNCGESWAKPRRKPHKRKKSKRKE